MHFKVVSYADAPDDIQSVRYQVFQVEQGVDPALEFDRFDPIATHLVGYINGDPIATARIRELSPTLAKIERVAVLADYRGRGIGKAIMEAAIALVANRGVPEIKINSQVQAQPFYQKLGFAAHGDVFDEAGIPHIAMQMCLEPTLHTHLSIDVS